MGGCPKQTGGRGSARPRLPNVAQKHSHIDNSCKTKQRCWAAVPFLLHSASVRTHAASGRNLGGHPAAQDAGAFACR